MSRVCSKVLLCGEYSVLEGSPALVVPFSKYSGELGFMGDKEPTPSVIQSNRALAGFYNYLQGLPWIEELQGDMDLLQDHIQDGLFFDSTIPQGYGLGSSGALVASVFRAYFPQLAALSICDQKEVLAGAESYFHGNSSGLDPLCAYRNQLLRVHGARVEGVPGSRTNPVLSQFYLFDTRIYASTRRLVDEFYKLLADKDRKKHYVKYVENVDSMVQHVLTSDTNALKYDMIQISRFQLEFFRSMIPDTVLGIWQQGLDGGQYTMKLCGSGGGGYLLVYSNLTPSELNLWIAQNPQPILDWDVV